MCQALCQPFNVGTIIMSTLQKTKLRSRGVQSLSHPGWCWGLHPLWTLASWKAMPSRDVLEAWHFLLAPHVPSPLCGGCVCPQSQRFFGAQDCEDQSPGLTLWTASV